MVTVCTYCGGLVIRRHGRSVHATMAERIPAEEIRPGDYVSGLHNFRSQVGSYDLQTVRNVRHYIISGTRAITEAWPVYSLPARGGAWTVRRV